MTAEDVSPDVDRREQTSAERPATSHGLERRPLRRRFTLAGLTLGVGLGGFIDGIVLHQILQWHHMLTDYGNATYPVSTVPSLEDNTYWDGLFHLSTWLFVTLGLFLLWRVLSAGYQVTWRSMVGLLLAGWGSSTSLKVSSTIISSPSTTCATTSLTHCGGMSGFLASGALLVIAGFALRRRDLDHTDEAPEWASAQL
jgi:uncharacterized membrane protein